MADDQITDHVLAVPEKSGHPDVAKEKSLFFYKVADVALGAVLGAVLTIGVDQIWAKVKGRPFNWQETKELVGWVAPMMGAGQLFGDGLFTMREKQRREKNITSSYPYNSTTR